MKRSARGLRASRRMCRTPTMPSSYERYAAELRAKGKSEREAATTIASLKAIGDRAEIERWNRILTAPNPAFNTSPNAFLVAVTKGLKPGRSLDVGMGQGRNTIYLAQQGWDSAGFDPAEQGGGCGAGTGHAAGREDHSPGCACRGLRLGRRPVGPHRPELCRGARISRPWYFVRCVRVAWSLWRVFIAMPRRLDPSEVASYSIPTNCFSCLRLFASFGMKIQMPSGTSVSSIRASYAWRP